MPQVDIDGLNSTLKADVIRGQAATSTKLGGDLDLDGNDITGTGGIPAANLTGTLPAINGSSLTGLLNDVVDDTTPTLGGNLDADSKDITNIGNLTLYTSGSTGSIEHKRCDYLNAITANTWVPIYTITCGATLTYGTGTVRAKINMHNTGNWHIFESDWNWYQTNSNPTVAQFGTDRSYYSSAAMMDFRLTQSGLVISVEAYFSNAISGVCYASLYTDVQYGGTNPTSLTFS